MKIVLRGIIFLFAAFSIGSAQAGVILVTSAAALGENDSINWSQLGPTSTVLWGPQLVSSTGGVSATASSTGAPLRRIDQGSGWGGNFTPGESLLWVENGPDITLSFATAVSGVGAQIQNNLLGSFAAQIIGIGGTVLGTFTENGLSNANTDGSAIFIGLLSDTRNISSVIFSVQSKDFAIGAVALNTLGPIPENAIPEPASIALFGLGTLGIALSRRSKRKQLNRASCKTTS